MGPSKNSHIYDLHSRTKLPLDGCSAQVSITDVHASVAISQRFTCPNTLNSPFEGVYTFALMRNAAVCEFEMVRGDGTKVEGIVKEKREAKWEYDQAVKQSLTASLGQQETGDVFSICIGNIRAAETVTINLRYIQFLIDDEKRDQVKFIFPRTYCYRYGSAPTPNTSFGSTAHQPFQMNVIVQQADVIKGISCPSGHPISLEFGPQTPGSHSASISLTNSSVYLTQDVVLIITAAGLDAPRCFHEHHPSPNHDTTALALTFVPRFSIPDVSQGMEYIFLVDRSGSMRGQNIELVREALVVLLRGLPTHGTTFNIFSFGSHSSKLWDHSQAYNQSSLEEATRHADSMQADYGGTEIASALRFVYDSFPKPLVRPIAVFLLTDGGAWNISSCVEYTSTARTTLPDAKSFVRVFSVGIGDGASSDTCESIARAGGGMTVYVKQGEPLTGKCSRLVRAARTPQMKVDVVWGLEEQEGVGKTELKENINDDDDDFELVEQPSTDAGATVIKTSTAASDTSVSLAPAIINLFDPDSDALNVHPSGPPPAPPKPNPTLPPPPRIQQSPPPGQISSFFPGTRTQIYAIIRTPMTHPTTKIKIQGVVTATGDLVELIVPVSKLLESPTMPSTGSGSDFPFLHTLAAKAMIKDREEGKHAFPSSISALFEPGSDVAAANETKVKERKELKEAYLEKDIVRLGTDYHLASRYTSFVAVDRSSMSKNADGIIPNRYGAPQKPITGRGLAGSARLSGASSLVSSSGPPTLTHATFNTSYEPALANTVVSSRNLDTTTSGPRIHSSRPMAGASAAGLVSGVVGPMISPSGSSNLNPSAVETQTFSNTHTQNTRQTPGSLLTAVARHQQWHGGFQLCTALLELLGEALNTDLSSNDVDSFTQRLKNEAEIGDRDVGATLLALIWMGKYSQDTDSTDDDETLDMREKAEEWVQGQLGGGAPAVKRLGELKAGVQKMLSLN